LTEKAIKMINSINWRDQRESYILSHVHEKLHKILSRLINREGSIDEILGEKFKYIDIGDYRYSKLCRKHVMYRDMSEDRYPDLREGEIKRVLIEDAEKAKKMCWYCRDPKPNARFYNIRGKRFCGSCCSCLAYKAKKIIEDIGVDTAVREAYVFDKEFAIRLNFALRRKKRTGRSIHDSELACFYLMHNEFEKKELTLPDVDVKGREWKKESYETLLGKMSLETRAIFRRGNLEDIDYKLEKLLKKKKKESQK